MFSRRTFMALAGAGALTACAKPAAKRPRLSVTMDDFNQGPEQLFDFTERNARILETFAKHNHKAAGFVTGSNVDTAEGRAIVQSWNNAGHMLGNHTWSHKNSSDEDPDEIIADIEKNHEFLSQYPTYENIFRFPFLAEGGSPEKIAYYRAFMKREGIQNAAVTIGTSDWFTTARLDEAIKKNPNIDTTPYRDYYVKGIVTLARHFQNLAERVGYGDIPHSMLMHHNTINGLYLDDVLTALKADGWDFVDASETFKHPIYRLEPETPTRGRSVLSVIAQEQGIDDTGFPGEYKKWGGPYMDSLGL